MPANVPREELERPGAREGSHVARAFDGTRRAGSAPRPGGHNTDEIGVEAHNETGGRGTPSSLAPNGNSPEDR
ncbi:MAG: hypothetical protein QOJ71_67 [Actinomycetota bacterium]|nr:hypothetical protein [Actinomycetota bacterium]